MTKIRQTKQKEIIAKSFGKIKGFFTAEDLHNLAKKEDHKIGIATVYRFLNDLKHKDEIYSYLCDRRTLYSKEKNSHCHYICERTGKIIHFEIDNIDFLKKVKEKIPGSITSFQLEIKGICDDCKT